MEKGIYINNLKTSSELTAAEFKKKFSNAQLSLNTSGDVVVKDSVFGQEGYNCIEIGLSSKVTPPTNVTIEGCDFTKTLSNNAILVFGTQDNAIINIKNCKFAKVSNVLRLSNKTNAKNVVVNIENCSVEQWEEVQVPYCGFIDLEDYTSASEDEFLEANRFSPEKMTINIKNLTHKGVKVCPEDLATCVATKDTAQVIYLCVDKVNYKIIDYDPDFYPAISFS